MKMDHNDWAIVNCFGYCSGEIKKVMPNQMMTVPASTTALLCCTNI